jgi:hypothetical protein
MGKFVFYIFLLLYVLVGFSCGPDYGNDDGNTHKTCGCKTCDWQDNSD